MNMLIRTGFWDITFSYLFQTSPVGHMEMMPGCSRYEEPHECEHRHGAFLERGIHVRAQISRLLNHSGSSHGDTKKRPGGAVD